MLVCHCNKVCDQVIRQCVRDGATSLEAVEAACRVGSDCGGCLPLVRRLVVAEREALVAEAAPVSSSDALPARAVAA